MAALRKPTLAGTTNKPKTASKGGRANGTDAAKRRRLADMLSQLRADAEALAANADRLIQRIS